MAAFIGMAVLRWPLLVILGVLAPIWARLVLASPRAGAGGARRRVNLLTCSLIWVLGSLSLVAIGGGNTVLPELHVQSVWNYKWLTDGEFADIFAIAQAAPGPSTALMAALIGMKAAGWPGALVAALAMLLPAAALACVASFAWERFRRLRGGWRWKRASPPSPWDSCWPPPSSSCGRPTTAGRFIVTGIATVLLAATRINPLIVMAGAGFSAGSASCTEARPSSLPHSDATSRAA